MAEIYKFIESIDLNLKIIKVEFGNEMLNHIYKQICTIKFVEFNILVRNSSGTK